MATPIMHIYRNNNNTHTDARGESTKAAYVWAAARLSLAAIFLWAFVDKLFGLGYATPAARSVLNGGSPTNGYLANTEGWFAPAFHAIAGHPVTDLLFMAALVGVGMALLLGIGMRVAAVSGAALMGLMYLAAIPGVAGTTNPLVDDHVVYALVLIGLATVRAGGTIGFGRAWSQLPIVKKYPILE